MINFIPEMTTKLNAYRKIISGLFMIVFISTASHAFGAQVLFVVGDSNLKTGDLAIQSHLEGRGHTVHIRQDTDVKSGDAIGRDLVILSESARSKEIGTKFRDVTVPVICSEPWIYNDLGMTGQTKRVDFGRKSRQKDIVIINARHPMAGENMDYGDMDVFQPQELR